MPQEDQEENFKENITEYITKLKSNEDQSEEFQKSIFRNFLKKVILDKQIHTSDRSDLETYNGKTNKNCVVVIIEYKKTRY